MPRADPSPGRVFGEAEAGEVIRLRAECLVAQEQLSALAAGEAVVLRHLRHCLHLSGLPLLWSLLLSAVIASWSLKQYIVTISRDSLMTLLLNYYEYVPSSAITNIPFY
jgi:hypothetical protein